MTRHFFRFMMVDGSVVDLLAATEEDARKVIMNRWTSGASTYFTPWMHSIVTDRYGDPIPDGDRMTQVNLVHVASMERWERDA
jgi:hypothetical protein